MFSFFRGVVPVFEFRSKDDFEKVKRFIDRNNLTLENVQDIVNYSFIDEYVVDVVGGQHIVDKVKNFATDLLDTTVQEVFHYNVDKVAQITDTFISMNGEEATLTIYDDFVEYKIIPKGLKIDGNKVTENSEEKIVLEEIDKYCEDYLNS